MPNGTQEIDRAIRRQRNIRRSRRILPVPPPSYASTVLGVWTFNGTANDSVGQNDFVPSTGSATYTYFDKYELLNNGIVTRRGLTFEDGKSYSVTPSYSYSGSFTMVFWWYSPGLVGFTRHATTRELEPKVAPIIAKADVNNTNSRVELKNSTFVITEVGASKTENAIRVYLTGGGSDISHIITSESYEPGLIYVLVTYIQSQGRLRIDINGKTGVLHSAPTGSLERVGALSLNNIVPGYVSHAASQVGGYIFDLIFTTYASLDNEALKGMRYGYEHIAYESLFDTRFMYFGLSYSQPTTLSTTHLFVNGGSVYATRSNGEIMRGDRGLWDKQFDYPDPNSINLLTTSSVDSNREVSWSTDGLKLKGVSISI